MNNDYLDLLTILGIAIAMGNYDLNMDAATSWDLEHKLDAQTKIILDRLESKLDKILENQVKGCYKND